MTYAIFWDKSYRGKDIKRERSKTAIVETALRFCCVDRLNPSKPKN